MVVSTVCGMKRLWSVGIALAALELVPGEPSDLTAVLRSPDDRRTLLGDEAELGVELGFQLRSARPVSTALSPLARYLVEHLDHGRVENWVKILERGVRDGRYRPMLLGWQEYPARLRDTWDAPPILFRGLASGVQNGQSSSWNAPTDDKGQRTLAIVGGRKATQKVLASTAEVASAVAAEEFRVISGLAAGVDTAAHRAALEVGGTTTAVMGTGIDRVFPDQNKTLAREIAERGVLLSQFAPPAPRTGTTFLRRNCVIAALSDASLIMDGRSQSGSRNAIEQAIRYGKPAFLWRPALDTEQWAHETVRVGVATFVDSADDLLKRLR